MNIELNSLPMKFSSPEILTLYQALLKQEPLISSFSNVNSLPELVFMISAVCNMRCAYCYADFGTFNKENRKLMSTDTAVAALDFFAENFDTLEVVKISGGEPSLNTDAIESISHNLRNLAEQQRIKAYPHICIISNLFKLESDFVEAVKDYDLSVLASFDGPPNIHNELRLGNDLKGTFEPVYNNIKKLLGETGQPEIIECIYTPIHYKQGWSILDTANYLKSFGINRVNMHFVADFQGFYKRLGNTFFDYANNIRNLQRKYIYQQVINLCNGDSFGLPVLHTLLERLLKGEMTNYCPIGQETLTVDIDGCIYPCCVLIGVDHSCMGNVLKTSSFNKLARKPFTQNAKAQHIICTECDIKSICGACIGDMIEGTDGSLTPFRISCESQIGMYEDFLEGIIWALARESEWKFLVRELGSLSSKAGRTHGCVSCSHFSKELKNIIPSKAQEKSIIYKERLNNSIERLKKMYSI